MNSVRKAKKVVMFTDIKDFTFKTSLLTSLQLQDLLDTQESLLFPIFQHHSGEVVKMIGDSYMVVFENIEKALDCAREIQKICLSYNIGKRLNLHKLELKIAMDYGEILKKQTIAGSDYFGDAVNLAARVEDITPENTIYVSDSIYHQENIGIRDLAFVGTKAFKGVLREVKIYELLYLESDIEKLKNGRYKPKKDAWTKGKNEKDIAGEADGIIFHSSAFSSILALQPLPLLDAGNVLPVQIYMLMRIAKIYSYEISTKEAIHILGQIGGALGLSYLTYQGVVSVSKILLPGFGGYVTIPVSFGMTYALGKVFSTYFYYKSSGVVMTNYEMKELFKDKRKNGLDIAKKQKKDILKVGREVKDDILHSEHIEKIVNELKHIKDAAWLKIWRR